MEGAMFWDFYLKKEPCFLRIALIDIGKGDLYKMEYIDIIKQCEEEIISLERQIQNMNKELLGGLEEIKRAGRYSLLMCGSNSEAIYREIIQLQKTQVELLKSKICLLESAMKEQIPFLQLLYTTIS